MNAAASREQQERHPAAVPHGHGCLQVCPFTTKAAKALKTFSPDPALPSSSDSIFAALLLAKFPQHCHSHCQEQLPKWQSIIRAAAQATGCLHCCQSGTDAFVCMHRDRQELGRCRCIAALGACLELVPEEDLDFPWPAIAAKQAVDWRMQPVPEPAVNGNYLTWTSDCSKLAQVDPCAERFHTLVLFNLMQNIISHCIRLCKQLHHLLLATWQVCNA